MNKKVDSSDIRQKMMAHDDHYHAEKLDSAGIKPTKAGSTRKKPERRRMPPLALRHAMK